MKEIDKLPVRNRKGREFIEKVGSGGLALTSIIGLVFLLILVYQIAKPTIIGGEEGEIVAATEFLPISDYILKWDHPSVDEDGNLISEPIILQLAWDDENGSHEHEIEITVISQRNVKENIQLNENGVNTNEVTVGKKTKFYIYSTLSTPVSVHQISGPTPAANETGYPLVNTFVIQSDVSTVFSNGVSIEESIAIISWSFLMVMIFVYVFPNEKITQAIASVSKNHQILRWISLVPFFFFILYEITVFRFFIVLNFFIGLRMLANLSEGIFRLSNQMKPLNDRTLLKHSIVNRDGLMLWARLFFLVSIFFIPLNVHIPFLTERYQDIFQPYSSGIRSAFYGTFWVMGIAMVMAIPVSIGAAIYLEEYAKPTRLTKLIQALITNLAGVPSIVFGLFGLAIFVREGGFGLGFGPSIFAAGLTMGVMAMPIIVLAAQEALRSVPRSIRESAYGIGCTRWQVTKDHVLPSAMPGMMTGTILAMSRIVGEAAPLLVVGAFGAVLFDPEPFAALTDGNINFTVIPIQIYAWTAEPGHEWHAMAAAASIALIAVMISMNSIAIILREYYRRRLNS